MSQPIAKLACQAPFHANLLLWYLTADLEDIRACDVSPKARLDDDVRTRVCIWGFRSLKTANFDDTMMAVLRHYAEDGVAWWAACDILQENNIDLWGYRPNLPQRTARIPFAHFKNMVREHLLHVGDTSDDTFIVRGWWQYQDLNGYAIAYNYARAYILPVS